MTPKKTLPSKKKTLPKNVKFYLSILAAILPFSSLLGNFYDEGGYRGFYYFEDMESQEEEKQKLPKTPKEALVYIQIERERLEGLQALAVCNPTTENIALFLEQRNRVIGLASRFSDQGALTLLERPDLGPETEFPTTGFGIEFRKRLEEAQQQKELEEIGKRFFLLVVGMGKEPWSELAASIGETFFNAMQKTSSPWTVRFLSLNGEKTEADLKTEFNTSILETFPLQKTPTFLIVCPEDNTMLPVGTGAPSVSLLMEAIVAQFKNHSHLESNNAH